MDRSPPGSSVHGISQAKILQRVAISFSRGSSWPRDQTQVSHISCTGRQVLYHPPHLWHHLVTHFMNLNFMNLSLPLLLLLSRFSRVWLRDPQDGSPPGSAVPGILQARTLEWVAISFSSAWKEKWKWSRSVCPTLSDPMDCSLPGSCIHGIFQVKVLEWVAIAFPCWYVFKLFPTFHYYNKSEVAQSCPTLCDPMDCSLRGSSVHGIFQARVLEWGAIAFSHNKHQWASKNRQNQYKKLPIIFSPCHHTQLEKKK